MPSESFPTSGAFLAGFTWLPCGFMVFPNIKGISSGFVLLSIVVLGSIVYEPYKLEQGFGVNCTLTVQGL